MDHRDLHGFCNGIEAARGPWTKAVVPRTYAHATTAGRSEERSVASSVTGRTPKVSGLAPCSPSDAPLSLLPLLIIGQTY